MHYSFGVVDIQYLILLFCNLRRASDNVWNFKKAKFKFHISINKLIRHSIAMNSTIFKIHKYRLHGNLVKIDDVIIFIQVTYKKINKASRALIYFY